MGDPTIEETYEEAKRKAKEFYSKIGRIWCPALRDYISFNGMGFRHLVRKRGVPRSAKEQKRRFTLLPFAEELLRKAETVSTEDNNKETAHITYHHHRRDIVPTQANFYKLRGFYFGREVTIIIRQFKGGNKHFLSVY